MSEQLKESLSAVMDGEADEFEIRRVLNEAADDPELRGVWERYHLVRSVMRGEGRTRGADRLSARFWTQIDAADEAPVERTRSERNGRRTPVRAGRRGVNASPVLRSRQVSRPRWSSASRQMNRRNGAAGAGRSSTDQRRTGDRSRCSTTKCGRQTVPAALDLQRAHAYMLHHAHHVALNNRSVVPFVKVAAFESTK